MWGPHNDWGFASQRQEDVDAADLLYLESDGLWAAGAVDFDEF